MELYLITSLFLDSYYNIPSKTVVLLNSITHVCSILCDFMRFKLYQAFFLVEEIGAFVNLPSMCMHASTCAY